MSALNAYLSEVRRQRELLEEAHERDGLAEEFCIDGAPPGIRRRIWTRQDRNRVFFKPRFLPSLVAQQQLPNYRASTRLERIVSRLRRRGIDGWHRAAMAEAGANGTFPVVAERLAAVSAIHQMLVNAYDEHLPEDWNGDWAGLQERHQRAVDELAMFATGGAKKTEPLALRLTITDDPPQAILDGTPFVITAKWAKFLKAAVDANGGPVSMADYGLRSRDLEAKSFPQALRDLMESQPGSGSPACVPVKSAACDPPTSTYTHDAKHGSEATHSRRKLRDGIH